jgi:microcystin-dependent protein
MSTPFLGELKIFSFNFSPRGWAMCNGQTLPISQNAAPFAILGTTYGGDGTTNFALPNLQGATPIGAGGNFVLGAVGGEVNHTLIIGEMPSHTHVPEGNTMAASAGSPSGALWAQETDNSYSAAASGSMLPAAIGNAGGSQPHNNMQPYSVLNICIALVGIFPSRN